MHTQSHSLSSTYLGLFLMKSAPSLLGDLGRGLSPLWVFLSSLFWEELASVITDSSRLQAFGDARPPATWRS